ncbi:MAG: radical SAM protein [Deltaproteobacteria bacterium]|nr:radical SAM protein [Deltaproteobacteria bacterium]
MTTGDLLAKSYNAVKALMTRSVRIDCDRIPYQFHNVPMKKIVNWIIVEVSIFFKPERPWGWPTHLQIEPSTLCNLRCAFCPVTTGLGRPTGLMGFDMFKKLIDEVGEYVFLLLLWDWGEPFLNPSVYDMISYAKERNIRIVSSTNGHLFSRGDHADKLVRSGIDSIIFAVDGISRRPMSGIAKAGI